MNCNGCGGKILESIVNQIKKDILARNGLPGSVVIDYCDRCPPGALAEHEYLKLQNTSGRGFGIYEG